MIPLDKDRLKLLVVVSSLDLTQPFSATPAWWQLLKALYEVGVEVIATPYQGPAIESLWWRAEPNPAKFAGDSFQLARNLMRRIVPPKPPAERPADSEIEESTTEKVVRGIAQNTIAPLWERHLDRILTKEPDIDAVMFVTTPLNQHVGVAQAIRDKHNKPVFFLDGDVPASLPVMKGFHSGFRIYQGADMQEYTAFICNSTDGAKMLVDMGANEAHTMWFGVDHQVYSPIPVHEQDIDAFFFGHGREYRETWVDAMIKEPSLAMPDAKFAVRGKNLGDIGNTQELPYLSFNKLREYICRSKVNLVITRGAHASVYGSASSRPFELAAYGACMVANPYNGIELWFEPDKEIIVVNSTEEAIDRYQYLLKHDDERQAMGQAARERFLKQHTFQHRAHELVSIIKQYL